LAGCADLLDPAAAVVNGEKIPVDEVTEGLERFTDTQEYERLSAQGDEQAIKRQYEQGYLSQLIRRAVLQPRAEEFDVEVTDDEVGSRIDEIKNDFPSESAFAEALKEQGLDETQLEQLVADSLLEEELRAEVTAEAAPAEAELREFYEANEADFQQTHAQHILVDDRNLADTVRAQIVAAPKGQQQKVFEQLAKRHSTDDSNSGNGGDLGFSSPGDFVPTFEAALEKLEPGEVSEPVKTQFGWHVIRLIESRLLPFSEASPQIAEQLAAENEQRVWTDWVSAAYEDAEVKVNPRYGELDVASGQVVDASAEDIPGAEVPSPEATPEVPAGG
jgi:parvulin-like peptidyl-prolyl isomerase